MILIFQNISLKKDDFIVKKIDLNRANMKYDSSKILQKLEQFFSKNKIKIKSISYKKKSFFLNLQVDLDELIKTIDFIESIDKYSKISNFTFVKTSNELFILSLNIDFSKRYLKDKVKNSIQIRLNAIIGNRVNISGKWYKTNDKFKDYVIDEITKNSVTLIKKGQKIKIKVKNEYFK